MPKIYVLSKNEKNVKKFLLKIIIFTAVKYQSILHRRVFVMHSEVIAMKRNPNVNGSPAEEINIEEDILSVVKVKVVSFDHYFSD